MFLLLLAVKLLLHSHPWEQICLYWVFDLLTCSFLVSCWYTTAQCAFNCLLGENKVIYIDLILLIKYIYSMMFILISAAFYWPLPVVLSCLCNFAHHAMVGGSFSLCPQSEGKLGATAAVIGAWARPAFAFVWLVVICGSFRMLVTQSCERVHAHLVSM